MLVCLISTIENTYAQGEHGRRAGAELRVVLGDVRQLITLPRTSATQARRKGLEDRIRGGLSALDILFRLADQEAARGSERYLAMVADVLTHADAGEWGQAMVLLEVVEDRFRLKLPDYPDSESLRLSSAELHQRLCAGCHDNPDQSVERPAYNLYQQAKSLPASEFYARMLIGVRGDRVTGIDNPLSDAEIAGLTYLYKAMK